MFITREIIIDLHLEPTFRHLVHCTILFDLTSNYNASNLWHICSMIQAYQVRRDNGYMSRSSSSSSSISKNIRPEWQIQGTSQKDQLRPRRRRARDKHRTNDLQRVWRIEGRSTWIVGRRFIEDESPSSKQRPSGACIGERTNHWPLC